MNFFCLFCKINTIVTMSEFHIDEVYPLDKGNPILTYFQNGDITENFKSKDCHFLQNSTNNKKVVLTQVDNLMYAAEEKENELSKTLILARNKVTGKTRLIEVDCMEFTPIVTSDTDFAQTVNTSHLELSRKFGSKKLKQQMEQREKLKVNVKTVTEQMENVTQNINADQLDLTTYNVNNSDDFYIPPIDKNATKVEDVYNINALFSEEDYKKIYSELKERDYTTNMVPWIKDMLSSGTLSEKLTVIAVYASSLILLSLTMAKDITKKTFNACEYSQTLNEIILNSFTTISNNRRGRSGPYKDKSICYVIVLALILNYYKFDMDKLCQSLKISPKVATTKVRVTGASVVSSGKRKNVELRLPLNFKSGFRRKSAKF